ncbi:MAG: GNAT family N-acetyltransferase [Bacteroidota bacterium]|nr:GNAT family N-acetyltransferase [Bacteroidota bacterium]
MNLKIENPDLRLATRRDKPTIKKVLTESFKNDPCIQWLTAQSRHRNKLDVIMDYTIDETLENGYIYVTEDNSAVAMWKNEAKERFTWNFIKRNLIFLFKMGVPCVIRNLKSKADSCRQFPKRQKYWYLYTIGVLPEAQGKGLASKLMNPVIEKCKHLHLPLFLETANTRNVEIYRKKGFVVTETLAHGSTTLFYMKHLLT